MWGGVLAVALSLVSPSASRNIELPNQVGSGDYWPSNIDSTKTGTPIWIVRQIDIITEQLPADAGRFVALEILKYDIVGDVAAGGAEVSRDDLGERGATIWMREIDRDVGLMLDVCVGGKPQVSF